MPVIDIPDDTDATAAPLAANLLGDDHGEQSDEEEDESKGEPTVGAASSCNPAPLAVPAPDAPAGTLKDVRSTSIEFTEHPPPPHTTGEDITHLTYTPVCCPKPFDFTALKYKLSCSVRRIRFLTVVTMYNEGKEELELTMHGIAKNVDYMINAYDGKVAWENFAVVIVSDGRSNANKETLNWLEQRGLCDEELMAQEAAGLDVDVHLFEHTVQMVKSWNPQVNRGVYHNPLQTIFALKERNASKLNSHLWFFNAFAEQLQPTYTVLLDVGTIPGEDAIWRLFRSMDRDLCIAGTCGEIAVYLPKLGNFIVASQNFEYKISNIMDKAMQSVFGFITVLPGAFSAYRYEAIRMDEEGEGPLADYFRSLGTEQLSTSERNMYLAEDRILCFEILARKGKAWTLHYVKNAIAYTDVPMTLVKFIQQRRRWINGALFAMLYALRNIGKVWRNSDHNFLHKCLITLQFMYEGLLLAFGWILPANFFLTVHFVLDLTFHDTWIYNVFIWTYVAMVVILFVVALGNKAHACPTLFGFNFYKTCTMLFGVTISVVIGITISQFSLVAEGDLAPRISFDSFVSCSPNGFEIMLAAIFSLGCFFMAGLLHGELYHVCFFMPQYFFMMPVYVNVLFIHAVCNLHDLSWGTKGNDTANEEDDAKEFRSKMVVFWLLCNGLVVELVTTNVSGQCFLTYLALGTDGFNGARLLGSIIFIVKRWARGAVTSKDHAAETRQVAQDLEAPLVD
jgi:chitin synthase